MRRLDVRRNFELASEGMKLEFMLDQINYCQDSIKAIFRDGRPVATVQRELGLGVKCFEGIPTIQVAQHQGRFFSLDNRRLWTFKRCGWSGGVVVPVVKRKCDWLFLGKKTRPSKRGGGRAYAQPP